MSKNIECKVKYHGKSVFTPSQGKLYDYLLEVFNIIKDYLEDSDLKEVVIKYEQGQYIFEISDSNEDDCQFFTEVCRTLTVISPPFGYGLTYARFAK